MKVNIFLIGEQNPIEIEDTVSFETFVKDLFKKRFYVSLVDEGNNLALNTENITHVWEVKE